MDVLFLRFRPVVGIHLRVLFLFVLSLWFASTGRVAAVSIKKKTTASRS